MLKEDLEKAIVNANVCLKDWKKNKNHLYDDESIRSLVNSWVIRMVVRNNIQSYHHKKRLSREISKSLFFNIDTDKAYITTIRLNLDYIPLPYLDFEELNKRANDIYSKSSLPVTLNEFSVESIKQITFT